MPPLSISQATNIALDRAYLQAAGSMLEQIQKLTTQGEIQRALQELEAEAERLLAEDRRMDAENPTLIKALLVYGTLLLAVQSLILANSGDIEDTGIQLAAPSLTAKIFGMLSGQRLNDPVSVAALASYQAQLRRLGIDWTPDASAIATRYTLGDAWIDRMEGWGAGYADLTRNTIIQGIQNGWGPREIANVMRQHVTNIPQWAATNTTRTLQLTSYRDAVLALEIENSQFLLYKYRIEQLDGKTCAACIALHGTRMAIGERVEGHYNCRGTEAYALPGREQPEFMVADGKVIPWQSGEDWFGSQSAQRKAQQGFMTQTPAMLNAYKAGIPLSEFVGHHVDDVFGAQVVQKSLIDALGERAQEFYVRQ